MLEKGSYVPWSNRFLRYIDGKKDCGIMLKESILKGPYQMHTIRDLGNTTIEPHERMQTEADLTSEEKKQFEADIDAMNAILLGIPNDIYNYVYACKTANAMWTSVRRLIQGTNLSKQETDLRVSNEFDKFCSSSRESLESYYERKYVTMVHQANNLHAVDYDQLYDYVKHNEAYYVTHPPSINDFDDTQSYDFQGDANCDDQTDNLTTNVGNVRCGRRNTGKIARSSGNTAFVPKATRNTMMLLAKKDEVGIHLNDEENDFFLVDATEEEELEELNVSCIMMDQI
ncbi:hypothetical protein Tco_1092972 [Tanacetum coccineum]|uniref:Uncharacterized protein n=1 Tax=Tanacetum coccineum TaxID=301880 RepID=A0ABQ5ICM9_9ASTR